MRTPKQAKSQDASYRYYAGFSSSFVIDILDAYSNSTSRVLDPWNGSGTTSSVCAQRGLRCVGIDINPATIPVAWARLARPDLVLAFSERLASMKCANLFEGEVEGGEIDLSDIFFEDGAVRMIRSLRNRLILLAQEVAETAASPCEVIALSGIAFVVFSQAIADALKPLRGTNPSWFRRPKGSHARIKLDQATFGASVLGAAIAARRLTASTPGRSVNFRWPDLVLADSRSNLNRYGPFDLVVSSPPYCTRIDYAIATTPELVALGGFSLDKFAGLRHQIMGSVVTTVAEDRFIGRPGPTLKRTIQAIERHPTKAASTYYARYFSAYFRDLVRSLDELALAVPNGTVVLVVQNSYFKETEINLREIIIEQLEMKSFKLISELNHPIRTSIAGSNPRYKAYRESNVRTEHVLIFSNERTAK